jgi:hypothetical protein
VTEQIIIKDPILSAIQTSTHPDAQRLVWMDVNQDCVEVPVVEEFSFVDSFVHEETPLITEVCHLDHILQLHQTPVITCRYGVVRDTVYLSKVADTYLEEGKP